MFRILLASTLAFAPAGLVMPAKDAHAGSPPESTLDCPAKGSVEGVDRSHRCPGARVAQYRKVKIGDISVAANKNWEKTPLPGIRLQTRAAGAQKINERVAGLSREEMATALKAGGYEIVGASGQDVLEFAAAIIDLYINKPQVYSSSRPGISAVLAGEMTIVVELRDLPSGELLSRAYDRGAARKMQIPHSVTSSENEKEAHRIIHGWATVLVPA